MKQLTKFLFLAVILVFTTNISAQLAKTPAKELKSKTYHYLLYLPAEFGKSTGDKWPLIIYLHGKSACGTNLDKVRRYGLPFFLDRDLKLNAVVVAPQCPSGKNWVTDNWFLPFLEEVKEKYHIDNSRIYLTGMSLGGFGTFSLAIKYPAIFAAVAPLCGGGQPLTACAMKDIPTWVFHGDKDEKVPLVRSTEMVEALRKCGGNPKYSILKNQPHDIHKTYGDPALYEWMLSNSKNNIEPLPKEYADTTLKPKKFILKEIFRKKDKQKKNKEQDNSTKLKIEFD